LERGIVSQEVSLIDLAPTIIQLLNLKDIPTNYIGRDLSKYLYQKDSDRDVVKYPVISEEGKTEDFQHGNINQELLN